MTPKLVLEGLQNILEGILHIEEKNAATRTQKRINHAKISKRIGKKKSNHYKNQQNGRNQ